MFEEKLDEVIAGLEWCCDPRKTCENSDSDCPYYCERGDDKFCLDFLMEDALVVIEALRAERDDLRKDIEVLTEDLTAAREKLSWQEPSRTPNDWGEYPPEFPREGM